MPRATIEARLDSAFFSDDIVSMLDLFIPYEYGYDFKVIVTNKPVSAKKALAFHNGS